MAKKAIAKYIKRVITNPVKLKKKPKTKPTPRYRTDPKTGQKFLNRRATVSGVKKKTLKSEIERVKPAYIGAAAGAGAAYGISKTDKFKKTAKKLKEATDKIRAKDKEKKEKRKDNQRQK